MQKFFKIKTTGEEPTRETVLSFDSDTTLDMNAALKRAILDEFSDFSGQVECTQVNRLPDEELEEQLGGYTQQAIQLNQRLHQLSKIKKFLKLELRSKFKKIRKFKLDVERNTNPEQQGLPIGGDGDQTVLQEGSTSELATTNTESTGNTTGSTK